MRTLLLPAFLLIGIHAIAQYTPYTPSTVPNIKLENNSYVSNPDNIVGESAAGQIDAILANVEQTTTAQVAVVAIKSIGDADVFDFAQELFNTWGIGRSNNNGLLILLVEEQHTVRFHTGSGLEGVLPDIVCKQIQRDKMVPAFKQGDYNAGMLAGVEEVGKILTDPNYAAEIAESAKGTEVSDFTAFAIFFLVFFGAVFLIAWAVKARRFSDSKRPKATDFPTMRLKRNVWLLEFGGIPLIILIGFWIGPAEYALASVATLYLYFMATVFHRLWRERRMIHDFIEKRKYFEVTEYLRKSSGYWFLMAIIFPIPFIGYFPFHFVRKKYYRNHSRTCKLCDKEMIKLSDIDEDQYLTKNQQVEESIHSIDYDVWRCTDCGATEGWAFPERFTKYKICPACKTVAYYSASDRTLVSPTYTHAGKGEETHKCKACNKTEVKTYSIAKLVHSSSSGGSSSGGSSSSSSSGGSWGGGSSGGGGASSSW